jgi:hypothetical protein
MGRLHSLAYFLRQFREKFPYNVVRGESVDVLHFEILFTNNAAREEYGSRRPISSQLPSQRRRSPMNYSYDSVLKIKLPSLRPIAGNHIESN